VSVGQDNPSSLPPSISVPARYVILKTFRI
jgi:hypothetical protein